MAEYLIDNPPRIRQFRLPRRATPSGVVVVHTAESFPDEVGPDAGAENVARFIRDRTNFGSYHDLCDSDSIIHLVPYDAEAFHDGTGSNQHSYGVSAATQAAVWAKRSPEWRDATVRNMARASARYARWLKAHGGPAIPARRISRAQSETRAPGFISHAERDPARRSDPGAGFPWDDFLAYYAEEFGSASRKDWWFDMATTEEIAELQAAVRDTEIRVDREAEPRNVRLADLLAQLERQQDRIESKLDRLLAKE